MCDMFNFVSAGGKILVKVVMNEWLERLSFNIITKMIAGKRYFEYLQDVDDEEAHGIVKLMKQFMHISGEFVPSDLIPLLGWFGVQGHVLKSMKRIGRDLDMLVGSWVEEHKSFDRVNMPREEHDFIDVMLGVIEDDPASGHTRDIIIKANIMVSFFYTMNFKFCNMFSFLYIGNCISC